MEAYQAVVVALAALLVGALLPVLFQLAATLRAARASLAQASPAIASVAAVAERLERLTAQLEKDGRIESALVAVDSLSRTVAKLQDTARMASQVGAAIVPAVAAAVKAWQSSREGDAPAAPDEGTAEAAPPDVRRVS